MRRAKAFPGFAKKLIILLAWSISLPLFAARPDSVYVVAFFTQSEKEAIKGAEKIQKAGYRGEVYLAPLNKYVVTIGKVKYKQGKKFKQKALEKGVVNKYAYISTGQDFEKRIYPPMEKIAESPPGDTGQQTAKPVEKTANAKPAAKGGKTSAELPAKTPASSQISYKVVSQGVFVVVGSTNSIDNAIDQADNLFRNGYQGNVYWTTDQRYVVAMGPYAEGEIQQVKAQAIQKGAANKGAYVTDGKEFLERNYTTEGDKRFTATGGSKPARGTGASPPAVEEKPAKPAQPQPSPSPVGGSGNYFVVIKQTASEKEATTLAKDLEKKGYEVKVFLTDAKQYAVTVGYFPKDQAELVRENAVKYGDAGNDAALSTGRDFVRRVYPSS